MYSSPTPRQTSHPTPFSIVLLPLFLPMVVETSGGSGGCATAGCAVDLNGRCPTELRAGNSGACRSACEAFGSPEYCCSRVYANPSTCQPSAYSQMFKSACPRTYSYAFDDPTSTFTCSGSDYLVTFCPSSVGSLKSSQDPASATTGNDAVAATTPPGTTTTATEGSGVMLENDAWLASLATGGATPTRSTPPLLHYAALLVLATALAVLPPATRSCRVRGQASAPPGGDLWRRPAPGSRSPTPTSDVTKSSDLAPSASTETGGSSSPRSSTTPASSSSCRVDAGVVGYFVLALVAVMMVRL